MQVELSDFAVEVLAALVHAAWMRRKLAKGIMSCKANDDEELMVPYATLSAAQKDKDRNDVRAFFAVIAEL